MWLLSGQFGILAVVSASAAWLYWSSARAQRGTILLIAAAFLWGTVVAMAVVVLGVRVDAYVGLQLSEPFTQWSLFIFELALLGVVLSRAHKAG